MNFNPRTVVEQHFAESARVKLDTAHSCHIEIVDAATLIANAFETGHKMLICGNGGSAADSQHFAAELVSRYRMARKPLPAIALTTDSSYITAHSNDFGFNDIFTRQVYALGKAGDIFFGISTSGKSPNVVDAADAAKTRQMKVITLTGNNGIHHAIKPDVSIAVASDVTAHIQEAHVAVYHVICEMVERILFDF